MDDVRKQLMEAGMTNHILSGVSVDDAITNLDFNEQALEAAEKLLIRLGDLGTGNKIVANSSTTLLVDREIERLKPSFFRLDNGTIFFVPKNRVTGFKLRQFDENNVFSFFEISLQIMRSGNLLITEVINKYPYVMDISQQMRLARVGLTLDDITARYNIGLEEHNVLVNFFRTLFITRHVRQTQSTYGVFDLNVETVPGLIDLIDTVLQRFLFDRSINDLTTMGLTYEHIVQLNVNTPNIISRPLAVEENQLVKIPEFVVDERAFDGLVSLGQLIVNDVISCELTDDVPHLKVDSVISEYVSKVGRAITSTTQFSLVMKKFNSANIKSALRKLLLVCSHAQSVLQITYDLSEGLNAEVFMYALIIYYGTSREMLSEDTNLTTAAILVASIAHDWTFPLARGSNYNRLMNVLAGQQYGIVRGGRVQIVGDIATLYNWNATPVLVPFMMNASMEFDYRPPNLRNPITINGVNVKPDEINTLPGLVNNMINGPDLNYTLRQLSSCIPAALSNSPIYSDDVTVIDANSLAFLLISRPNIKLRLTPNELAGFFRMILDEAIKLAVGIRMFVYLPPAANATMQIERIDEVIKVVYEEYVDKKAVPFLAMLLELNKERLTKQAFVELVLTIARNVAPGHDLDRVLQNYSGLIRQNSIHFNFVESICVTSADVRDRTYDRFFREHSVSSRVTYNETYTKNQWAARTVRQQLDSLTNGNRVRITGGFMVEYEYEETAETTLPVENIVINEDGKISFKDVLMFRFVINNYLTNGRLRTDLLRRSVQVYLEYFSVHTADNYSYGTLRRDLSCVNSSRNSNSKRKIGFITNSA